MRRFAKALIFMLLFAALPLRGYAAALKSICEDHHGGSHAVHQTMHEQGSNHDHDSKDGEPHSPASASLCSLCGAYSVGAPLLSESAGTFIVLGPQPASRIPFRERRAQAFIPDHLERPPLPL